MKTDLIDDLTPQQIAENVKRLREVALRKRESIDDGIGVYSYYDTSVKTINALVQLVGEMSREVTDVVSTMSQCKRFESGVGGQTVEASLSRTYLHRVPLLCLHDLTETLTKAAPIAELAKGDV